MTVSSNNTHRSNVSSPGLGSEQADIPTAPNQGSSPQPTWSSDVQSLLDTPPPSLPSRLLIGGVLFCMLFGVWSYVGKISEVGAGQGQLVPQGKVYKVAPVQLGKVSQILIKEGETIQAGQAVVKLDSRLEYDEVRRLEQALRAYKDQLKQTQSLTDKAQQDIQAREDSAEAEAAAQSAAVERAKSTTATADSLRELTETDISVHENRLQRLTKLESEGAISQETIFEAEQALQNRQQALTQYQGDFQQGKADASRLIAEKQQRQAEGKRNVLEAQQRLKQLEVETAQLQAKVLETETLLKSAQTRLEQSTLYAPVSGVVLGLRIDNPDEVVQSGQPIAEIAPHNVPLVLFAKVPNREAGFIRAGMPAKMKFDAYPYEDYGVVEGIVSKVSPNTIHDEKLGDVYEVEISLGKSYLKTEHGLVKLKAGQTARAEITIRQRRIIDIFLTPFRQLQEGGVSL